jgi:hypothetical protein
MGQTKNLCAQIPLELYDRVRAGKVQSGKTLCEYVTDVLIEYYTGGINMTNRTLAIQIPEALFQRMKDYLIQESQRTGHRITQKEFVLSLIEQALEPEPETES